MDERRTEREFGSVFTISRNDTRDFAIVHANPRNYGALAREARMRRFQLCGHKWLIFSLATMLVSNTIFPRWVRVATGRFRTAYTTLTREESLADVARGVLWRFLSLRNAENNPSVQSEEINFTPRQFKIELIEEYFFLKKKYVTSNLYIISVL